MSSPAGIVTATLDKLARFLGASPHQQDVVYSEASARKALSRRAFLRTAGAVAAGVVLADRVAEAAAESLEDVAARYELRMTSYPQLVNRAPSSLTSYDAYLKEYYSNDERLKRLTYPDQPLLAMIEKRPQPGITASDYLFRRGDVIEVFRSQPGVAEYSFSVDSESA